MTRTLGARCGRMLIAAATIWLVVAATVYAAKTDVVVLRNGDRLTGEVKQLNNGQLKLSTDDAGTVYIEWDKIASVTTALQYEVVTRTGARYVGVLTPDPSGRLAVVAADGTVTRLAFLDVVSFASIKTGFLERIDGSLDVGGSYTHSSGVAQTSFALKTTYRKPFYNVFFQFESNVTRDHSSTTTSFFAAKAGSTHFRADQWIVSPFLFVERNAALGLSLRTTAALTAGRYLQRTSRSSTLVMVGAAAGREALTEGGTLNNLDALFTLTTSFYRYDYPRSSVDLSVMVFPELNRWGRVRSNMDLSLKHEIFKDFTVGGTLYDTLDTQPQVPGVSRHDVGVTLSIGWVF